MTRLFELKVNVLTRSWRAGFQGNGSRWNQALAVSAYDAANSGGGAGGRGKKRTRGRGGASASSGARSAAVGGGAADAAGRGSGGGVRGGRGRGGGAAAVPPLAAAAGRLVAWGPLLTVQQLRDAQNAVPPTPPRGSAQ